MHNTRLGLTNTEIERIGLDAPLNMSDGHARQPLDIVQRRLFLDFDELLGKHGTQNQKGLEQEFIRAFFGFCGQTTAVETGRTFLSYSASDELAMAAQLCRVHVDRVLLMEPIFDNIRYFVEDCNSSISPVFEWQLLSPEDIDWSSSGRDALFLVLPNNPTGFQLTEEQFASLCAASALRGAAIIVDASFRPSSTMVTWDMYRILEDTGVDYFIIEDTGKTWPLHDLKVGIGTCSLGFVAETYRRHDWLLLNVSPLILEMTTRLIRDSQERGLAHTAGRVLAPNKKAVHTLVAQTSLEHVGICDNVPLELLQLPSWVPPDDFFMQCRRSGLELLPAANYFWATGTGNDMFRIPLARPVDEVLQSCHVIEGCLS